MVVVVVVVPGGYRNDSRANKKSFCFSQTKHKILDLFFFLSLSLTTALQVMQPDARLEMI